MYAHYAALLRHAGAHDVYINCTPVGMTGGPAPDDAHLTGVVLRLNDDGTAPTDNPFYSVGAGRG